MVCVQVSFGLSETKAKERPEGIRVVISVPCSKTDGDQTQYVVHTGRLGALMWVQARAGDESRMTYYYARVRQARRHLRIRISLRVYGNLCVSTAIGLSARP